MLKISLSDKQRTIIAYDKKNVNASTLQSLFLFPYVSTVAIVVGYDVDKNQGHL